MQRVAAVDITETKISGAKGQGAILIEGFTDRCIADDRRIVDRRYVKGHHPGIAGQRRAIADLPGKGGVTRAVGVRGRAESQFADVGRTDHRAIAQQRVTAIANTITVSVNKQLTGGRCGDDGNGLQGVAAVHITETKIGSAKGLGAILIKGFADRRVADDRCVVDRRDTQHRLISTRAIERTVIEGPVKRHTSRWVVRTVGIGQGLQYRIHYRRRCIAIERQRQHAGGIRCDTAHRRAVIGEVLSLSQRPQQSAIAEGIDTVRPTVTGDGDRCAVIVALSAVKRVEFGIGDGDIIIHHHRAAIFGIGRAAIQVAEYGGGVGRCGDIDLGCTEYLVVGAVFCHHIHVVATCTVQSRDTKGIGIRRAADNMAARTDCRCPRGILTGDNLAHTGR